MTLELEKSIREWLALSLSEHIGDEVVAYCINLYDSPFRADLIGASRFDPKDEDWACQEVWSPSGRYLNLPNELATRPWDERLEIFTDILRVFLSEESSAALILLGARAVAVGFVDGNLTIVHQRVI